VPDKDDSDDDNDGLTDVYEQNESHTNPSRPDSDGDGTPDGKELVGRGTSGAGPTGVTNPNDDDSDDDGFTDTFENENQSDPNDRRVTPVGHT
jgi:hypothetical protein